MKQGQFELQVTGRETGRHQSRMLRNKLVVPGVVYGAGVKGNVHLCGEEKIIRKYASHEFENTILTLRSSDKVLDGVKVLVKEVSRHPVTQRPLHVDFWAIDLNKPIRVYVEVRFDGKAAGLAEGGVLQPLLREIEVECLPTSIPEFLACDVSSLGIHDTLHISDLKLPSGVKSVSTDDLAIVTVTVIREEEVAAPTPAAAAAAGAATPAEPEVIAKGKKPEEGAAAAAPGAKPAAGGAAAPAKPAAKK